ncbi:MAG: acetyl-CoA carboxylase biotin carboxyl carrier protein [Proteobacteria bacterium]|nr:acetyl-CoA carboxylase biotin carboxyl carrier protein [Pseudomonadota bacterium]NOG60504.1 acetyl-CoA carboxylase biotin carboxyl carrier protein [Pseudomonadota bacterium]
MDIRKVKKLIELLEESGIAEIEIHEGEESVRISRGSTITAAQAAVNVPQAVPVAQAVPVGIQSSATESVSGNDYSSEGHVITSPMVGIFYTSPSPEEPVFVSKGQAVKAGDVICIIEAMKIMNQIEADTDGKLLRVLVENGDAVEYGQPLFILEKS